MLRDKIHETNLQKMGLSTNDVAVMNHKRSLKKMTKDDEEGLLGSLE